ncbi:hypothetical protein Y1Q_0013779 [Alligator mississippiensis]|uniref:Uncharacterized protein n=1 Tax=Alligator mississippiensis TaxID=8496 RepID=A0A151MM38_ALLMI|nr:hypothetical protein Y1Q_0013779 [Alligator mississippiensis]
MSIIRVVKKNLPCEGVWSWQETYIGGGKSLSQRQIPAVKSVFWLLVITHPGALSCHVAPSLASLVTGTASKDLFTALTPQVTPCLTRGSRPQCLSALYGMMEMQTAGDLFLLAICSAFQLGLRLPMQQLAIAAG